MGKMMHFDTDIDESTMLGIDRLARSTNQTPDALLQYAIARLLEDAANEAAFIQEGIDAVDRGDVISHDVMVAEIETLIAMHRSRCTA